MEDFDSKAVLNPENSFPVSHTPEEVSGAVVPPLYTITKGKSRGLWLSNRAAWR